MRTEELLKQSQSPHPGAAEPAGGAAADQRGAGGEGPPARRAERRGGAQEPRGRAGPAGARGEGRAARPHLQVQVGVPGQHVARAAHAAQLACSSWPSSSRTTRTATSPPSRWSSPRPSTARATTCSCLINDILDLSKIESGTVHVDVGEVPFAELREYVERTFRQVAESKGLDFDDRAGRRACRESIQHRREAPAAGPQEPALQRLQVHRAGQREPAGLARRPGLEPGPRRR